MYVYISLLINWLITVKMSLYFRKKNNNHNIILLSVLPAITEELLFRMALKQFLQEYTFHHEFISVLFGVAHLMPFIMLDKIDIYLMITTVFCNTFLGYNLILLNSLIKAIISYALYNFSLMIVILYSSKTIQPRPVFPVLPVRIRTKTLRKSLSYNDLIKIHPDSHSMFGYENCVITLKIPNNLQQSFNKFNNY